jgi:mRNA-degrading endonuclease YafQ of YafQ-DinJ toxin-antitoxin module
MANGYWKSMVSGDLIIVYIITQQKRYRSSEGIK